MRTTLNLDHDVAAQLAARAKRESRSLSRIANDVLRAGFHAEEHRRSLEPYEPPVFDTGEAFVDVTDVAAALEVLDRDG